MIELIKIGTEVSISHENEGEITAISIRDDNHIKYEVSYWNNENYNSVWLTVRELKKLINKPSTFKIGFK